MLGKPDRHDWNELNTYLLIHEAYIDRAMSDGFVLSHDLDHPLVLPDTVILEGRVNGQNGIFLDVDRQLEMMFHQGRTYVRTHRYKYQAMDLTTAPRPVFGMTMPIPIWDMPTTTTSIVLTFELGPTLGRLNGSDMSIGLISATSTINARIGGSVLAGG